MPYLDCEWAPPAVQAPPTPWRLEAPWLQHRPGNHSQAFSSAIWLWMHDTAHRKLSVQELEHRLLAPIEAGQYVLAHAPVGRPNLESQPGAQALALLLFARFDEEAESRYLAEPTKRIAWRDWASGDRIWLIDWAAPFGHTLSLRHPIAKLFMGRHATSLRKHLAVQRVLGDPTRRGVNGPGASWER